MSLFLKSAIPFAGNKSIERILLNDKPQMYDLSSSYKHRFETAPSIDTQISGDEEKLCEQLALAKLEIIQLKSKLKKFD